MTSSVNNNPNLNGTSPAPSLSSSNSGTSLPISPQPQPLNAGQSLNGRVGLPDSGFSMDIMNLESDTRPFEKMIRVGNFYYKVTAQIPDEPQLNEIYLQTNLVPKLTQAIEWALQTESIKNAEQFDLTFVPDGIAATPHKSIGQNTGISSIVLPEQRAMIEFPNAITLSQNVRTLLASPERPIGQDSSSSSVIRTQPIANVLPIAPNSPVPFLEHGTNSCFLAVLIWVYLSNHPEVKTELQAKAKEIRQPTSPKENAILGLARFLTSLEAHQAAGRYVPKSEIEELRTILSTFKPELFPDKELSQKDAQEAITILLELLGRKDNLEISTTHTIGDAAIPMPSIHDVFVPLPFQVNNPTEVLKKPNGANYNLLELLTQAFNPKQPFDRRIEETQEAVKATSSHRLEKCPKYLEINLGRVRLGQKINGDIDVPLQMTLNASITNETPPPVYRLRSAIRHEGTTAENGHFTAILRKEDAHGNIRNYHCDDCGDRTTQTPRALIRETNDAYCLAKAKGAYQLVYERIDPPQAQTIPINHSFQVKPARRPFGGYFKFGIKKVAKAVAEELGNMFFTG